MARDLLVDSTGFFKQYHSIKPWLVNEDHPRSGNGCRPRSNATSSTAGTHVSCAPAARVPARASGGTPDKYVGPPGLLQAYRFLVESRDQATSAWLDNLEDPYRLFRCPSILNCTGVCPKGLNPALAISQIRGMLVRRAL